MVNIPGKEGVYKCPIFQMNEWNWLINSFSYLKPEENTLNRIIFPFPHLPSVRHEFYKKQKEGYFTFIKGTGIIH
jgi:hypothetical protein